jgi:simple sugar transport system permease protein
VNLHLPIRAHRIPLLATLAVFALLYTGAALRYEGFASLYVLQANLVGDSASLGLAAIGETFVILAGGIDLSVGAMVAFTSILLAKLVVVWHLPPGLAMAIVLATGALFGAGMGALVRQYRLPPFLVTLGGLFLLRGLALTLTVEKRLALQESPLCVRLSEAKLCGFPMAAVLFLAVLVLGVYAAHWTRFGRAVYALGGGEASALLMGLPVGRVKVQVYALSGLCAALGGVAHTFVTGAGDATVAYMMELDTIAAVVIGGTLLSGGVGTVFGTLVGVLILSVIQTAINFEGTLSSWWTKIATGGLLLVFILIQRLIQSQAVRRTGPAPSARPPGLRIPPEHGQ